MDIFAKILQYASITMLGVFGVFVLFGLLTGMTRGLKRSVLRLVLYVGLLVAVFFLTPIVTNAILGIDVKIAGNTPAEWIGVVSDEVVKLLKEQFGSYVAPFGVYITEFATGLVLAVVNMVLFLALYFVLKFVTWIIYSIVAHFWAPRKDRMGNKIPKKVWGGCLVGALQGVCLFLFFMLPVNGLLGVVHQAVQYQNAQNYNEVEPQAVVATSYTNENGEVNLERIFQDIDDSLGMYQNVMRYTGLQFLTDRAFEYQLTVRMEGAGSINLVKDINSAWELYIDVKDVGPVFEKIGKMFQEQDYTLLTTRDYRLLRGVTNKVFDLQLLKLADWFLADLDEVMNTPVNEDESLIAGTEIHKESIYGLMLQNFTTDREVVAGANNQAEFAKSLRAVVNYVSDKKLNLLRHDLLNLIDLFENLNTYKIEFAGNTQTIASALSQNDLDWLDYINLLTSRLAVARGDYAVNTPILDVVGDNFKAFSLAQMLGLSKMENLLVYSNFLDEPLANSEDLQNLVYDMAKLFLGEKAYTKGEVQGSWDKFGGVMFELGEVLRDNSALVNDIVTMVQDGDMDLQAMIGKIGGLVITKEYYDAHQSEFSGKAYDEIKYQKVDALIDGIYDTIHAFAPVEKFVDGYIDDMNGEGEDENELFTTLTDLIGADRQVWYDKFRSLVSAANLMNNEALTDLMDKLGGEGGEVTTEDIAKVFDTIQEDMDAGTVAEIIDTVVNLPEVGETMKETVNEALKEVDDATLEQMFEGEDLEKAKESVDTLKNYFDDEYAGEEITKEQLESALGDLLGAIEFSDYIQNLTGQGA